MRSPDEHDAQIHAEVEDFEDLRLGEGQDDDAAELGQGDAGQDGAPHVGQGVAGPLDSIVTDIDGKRSGDMR